VDGVPTLENCYLGCRLEEILEAHRAVLAHGILYARVRVPNLVRITASASIAMEVVFSAADPADPAPVAMKDLLLFPFVVPELALGAVIGAEDLAATNALAARLLRRPANLADHLLDLRPVKLMRLGVVVTMATPERLATTRRHNATSAPVVAAASAGALGDVGGDGA